MSDDVMMPETDCEKGRHQWRPYHEYVDAPQTTDATPPKVKVWCPSCGLVRQQP